MKNEELKKKIVEIIINAIWKDAEADYDSTDETEAGSIADALIAAGIGDVEESENKATAAELVAQVSASTAIEKIAEWKHRAEVAEKAFDLINKENPSCFVPYSCHGLDCIECAKKYFYEQAEKELAEEAK